MFKMLIARRVARMYGLEASTTINFYHYCDMVSLWKAYFEYLKLKRYIKESKNYDEE